jgi:solute:Na+ symporter, SSS family
MAVTAEFGSPAFNGINQTGFLSSSLMEKQYRFYLTRATLWSFFTANTTPVVKSYRPAWFLCFWLLTRFIPVEGQPSGTRFSAYLREVLENQDDYQLRIQAAEALLRNNFPVEIQRHFHRELNGKGPEKIGALALLAWTHRRDSTTYDSLGNAILREFRTLKDEEAQLMALEHLGRSGWKSTDEEIRQLGQAGQGKLQSLASWVLANSGNTAALTSLVQELTPADTSRMPYAALALRSQESLPDPVYRLLKEHFESLGSHHPLRVYPASALWVHAPAEDQAHYRNLLLSFLNGQPIERREVFEALARKGIKTDLELIREKYGTEPDATVRVAAAKAYLANEHHLQSKVGWPDWMILIAYGCLLLGIGWYYSYLQKNKEDYFLGGRTVSPFVSGISMYVSFFSAISYLAVAGEVIKYGPVIATVNILSAPIIFLLGSYFLIPYFMNLRIISAYEILEKPLGTSVRKVASLIFVITRLVWMALLIFLAAKSMTVMMGWNDDLILTITVVLGIITILYTAMGGLKAVLLTDVIQFFILLLGAVLTIAVVVMNFGGFGAIIPTSWSDNWTTIEFFNFSPYVRLTVFFALVNNITWWICTTGADQMAIQRFVSTKDLKSARKSFLITQTGQVTIIVVLVLVGLSVMQFYQNSPNLLPQDTDLKNNADFLFPNFIANQFPSGMSGLVIAALFSASMSSLSSGINSVSSVLTTDIFRSAAQSDSDSLKNIRITSGGIGMLVIVFSLIIPLIPGNIIEVTAKTNGLFIAPLFNLFYMALFVKKAKPMGVIAGSVYGLLAAFTIAFWDVLTGNPPWSFLWIGISSLIVSICSSYLFSLLLPPISGKKPVLWGLILMIPWIFIYSVILF